jgi:hypothetical protein
MSADEIRQQAKQNILNQLNEKKLFLETVLLTRKIEKKEAEIRARIEAKAGEPVFVQLDVGPEGTIEDVQNAIRVVNKLITNLSDE